MILTPMRQSSTRSRQNLVARAFGRGMADWLTRVAWEFPGRGRVLFICLPMVCVGNKKPPPQAVV